MEQTEVVEPIPVYIAIVEHGQAVEVGIRPMQNVYGLASSRVVMDEEYTFPRRKSRGREHGAEITREGARKYKADNTIEQAYLVHGSI